MRIVSLVPSATEILFALGAGGQVVGVTFECDHPAQARGRRIVSTSTLPEGLDAAGIDAYVARLSSAGESLYLLDEGALSDLDADLVITPDLCAVCAVDVASVQQALEHLGCRAEVLTTDPHNLAEVFESIVAIGDATGTSARARELVLALSARLETVRRKVEDRRRVPALVLEWTDPPFAPGHWVPDMVTWAGGECVLGWSGERSFRTTWPDVAAAGAEVVICAPCGFDLAGSMRLAGELLGRDVLPEEVDVWAVDANASFARPGPRLVDGVEAIASILHPGTFDAPDPQIAGRVNR